MTHDGVSRRTGPPDFIGVGAQRSGTSWWFACLLRHPRISGNAASRKELHYFDRFHEGGFDERDVAAYHALFPRVADCLVGEWTPRYMYDFWTPRMLAAAAPTARLLVMLRDPVERFSSGYFREVSMRGLEPWQRKAIANGALARSRYHEQIARLRKSFSSEQVLLLQYERCVAEPAAMYRRTLSFLGVEQLDPDMDLMRTRVGQMTARACLEDDLREVIVNELREDIALLGAECPEIDTELWPDFAL